MLLKVWHATRRILHPTWCETITTMPHAVGMYRLALVTSVVGAVVGAAMAPGHWEYAQTLFFSSEILVRPSLQERLVWALGIAAAVWAAYAFVQWVVFGYVVRGAQIDPRHGVANADGDLRRTESQADGRDGRVGAKCERRHNAHDERCDGPSLGVTVLHWVGSP